MKSADEVVVLAGGLGARLRDVVNGTPKPLAPVAGRPFLMWILDRLAAQQLRRVVMATGYLGEQIEAALGQTWLGMDLVYSREPAPLGTGGALALALRKVEGQACFVLNGDTSLDLNYAAFARSVDGAGARLGIALAEVPDVARYGAVRLDGNRVTGFDEKGTSGVGFINAGTYYLRRDLLDDAPVHEFSFEREVLVRTVVSEPVLGYMTTSGFIDIGVPDDYRRAQTLFSAMGGAP